MRLRRKKMMLNFKIISLLCCVAIVSVGFASWVITGVSITNNASNGNFTAYDSTDKNVTIEPLAWFNNLNATNYTGGTEKPLATGATVLFGKSSSSPIANAWLTSEGEMETDQLIIALSFSVTNTAAANYYLNFDIIDYSGVYNDETTAKGYLSALVASGAVAAPQLILYQGAIDGNGDVVKAHVSNSSFANGYAYNLSEAGIYNLVIKFGWGAASGNENPYDYFNDGINYSQNIAPPYTPQFKLVDQTVTKEASAQVTVAHEVADAVLKDVYYGLSKSGLKFALKITGGLGTAPAKNA